MASLDLNGTQVWGLVLQVTLFLWALALITFVLVRSKEGVDQDLKGLRSFGWLSLFVLPPMAVGAWALSINDG